MGTDTTSHGKDRIERAIALAADEKPAYSHLFSFLEAFFIARAEAGSDLRIEIPQISGDLAATRWENGLSLIYRWDFPIDIGAAERILEKTGRVIPGESRALADAFRLLSRSVPKDAAEKERFWSSFLHHEMEPWEEWIDLG